MKLNKYVDVKTLLISTQNICNLKINLLTVNHCIKKKNRFKNVNSRKATITIITYVPPHIICLLLEFQIFKITLKKIQYRATRCIKKYEHPYLD